MANPGDIRAGGAAFEITADKKGLQDTLDNSEAAFKKFRSEASRIAEGLQTPLEKLELEMKKIQTLGQKGYLDPTQTERGIAQVKKQIGELSGGGGFFKDLKKQFGEESGFGLVIKSLAGAGAIAGIGMAGKKFEELTAGVAAAADKFRLGKTNFSEMTTEFIKSIPIIGSVVSGLGNIGEAITGAQAKATALAERRATDKATAEAISGAGLPLDMAGEFVKGSQSRSSRTNRDLQLSGMGGMEKAQLLAAIPFNDASDAAQEAGKKQIDLMRAAAKKELEKLDAILRDPKTDVYDASAANAKYRKIEEDLAAAEKQVRTAILKEVWTNNRSKEQGIADASLAYAQKFANDFMKRTFGTDPSSKEKNGSPISTIQDYMNKQLGYGNRLLNDARNSAGASSVFSGFASQLGNAAFGGDLNSTTKDILKNTDIIARNISSGGMAFA